MKYLFSADVGDASELRNGLDKILNGYFCGFITCTGSTGLSCTGNRATRDEEGHYWYSGRSDDMLKVGGIWVSPVEVENTLIGHPAVLEAGVIGREDDDGLIKPKACVVLAEGHEGSDALAEELTEFVREKIAAYKRPRWYEFVDALPKTATGKIQRFRLREKA